MSGGLDEWLEAIQRRRAEAHGLGCLSDALLEALAEDTLPPAEVALVRDHLARCLMCLRAYGELRSLLEAARAGDSLVSTPPAAAAGRARAAATARRVWGLRLPLPLTGAVTAASILLTWATIVGPERDWLRPPLVGSPSPITELAGAGSRVVAGTVEEIRDASGAGVPAHVITLKDAAGATYAMVVWGVPAVGVGDAVTVQGVWSPVDDPGGGVLYKGVGTDVRRQRPR